MDTERTNAHTIIHADLSSVSKLCTPKYGNHKPKITDAVENRLSCDFSSNAKKEFNIMGMYVSSNQLMSFEHVQANSNEINLDTCMCRDCDKDLVNHHPCGWEAEPDEMSIVNGFDLEAHWLLLPDCEDLVHTTTTSTVRTELVIPLYPYTEQVRALQACIPSQSVEIPAVAKQISSPLKVDHWREALSKYPDAQFTEYIVKGISEGFRIGFQYDSVQCHTVERNAKSAGLHPEPIRAYLDTECKEGRVAGPFSKEHAPNVHCSRLGVIPKSTPGEWRLILDLSFPTHHSVNDGIAKDLCSLQYPTIDQAIGHIIKLGKGALLAKIDIKQAYRNIPVHPDDRHLLGMMWENEIYIDLVLPFGL